MNPPFRRFGAKTRVASKIVELLPEHDHFVEVFGGSAAVLFAKPRSRAETINDLDQSVVTFFRVLRDHTDELVAAVETTPYSRDEFSAAKDDPGDPDANPVEWARRFVVVSNQAVGNAGSGWAYTANSVDVNAPLSHRWARLPPKLAACAERLRGVQIDCIDWRDCIDRYDRPGVLLFCDPPYHHDTRENTVGEYLHEMTDDDHEAFVASVLGLRHAAVVVTHYPHPLYDRLSDAGMSVTDLRSAADNMKQQRQDPRVERVWATPLPAGLPNNRRAQPTLL